MTLRKLIEDAKLPVFKRFCDDENHMCMTVISSKDYGQSNTGHFNDEPDTVAITFHQLRPAVGCDTDDFGDSYTDLIITLVNAADEILALVEAARLVHCSCSIDEAMSGHRIECFMPELDAAIKALEAKQGFEQEPSK